MAAGLNAGMVHDIEANPHKSPRLENVQRIAKVLGVSLSYLVEGATGNEAPPGFAESDAEPWMPPRPQGQRPDLAEMQRHLPQMLAPSGRRLTTYRLRTAMPGFALLQGDVLIVDLNTPARQGDLVLATVVDLSTGAGTTLLRRYLPPYLVANDAAADAEMLVVDNHRTSIMGRVSASLRAPEMSAA
jgi:transcriptional regulator with XRE-family HTH domain